MILPAPAVPVLTFFVRVDGRIERQEALVLLAVFLTWLGCFVRSALRQRAVAAEVEATEMPTGESLLLGKLSLSTLVAAGRPLRSIRFWSGGVRLNDCSGES